MSSFSKSSSSCSSGDENVVEQLRRGPWTTDEDTLLVRYIAVHGEGRWNNLAKCSGLKRNGKSCRLRWLNYLKPDVKRGNLTLQEQLLILELHSKLGNRWSKIAQHLPGRTDNEIKNYWRTRVEKQAKHLNIDSNSTKFKEMIRFLWMPRLLEKIQRSSPSAPTNHPSPQFQTQTHRSLDHNHTNSSSELLADCSLDQFTQFPQVSQVISESPISQFYADDYDMYVDMESAAANVGKSIEPMWDCLRETNTWIHEEVEVSLWNMDELWELQEREN